MAYAKERNCLFCGKQYLGQQIYCSLRCKRGARPKNKIFVCFNVMKDSEAYKLLGDKVNSAFVERLFNWYVQKKLYKKRLEKKRYLQEGKNNNVSPR